MKKFNFIYILTLLAALLLAGCTFKSVYNRLDYFIAEYVSDMVELDDVLSDRVSRRSTALLEWHRSTQLPDYTDWLRDIQADINPSLDEARLLQHFDRAYGYWQPLSEQVYGEMAALLPLLDEEQRDELYRNIDSSNADYREDYIELDEAEIRLKYRDRLEDTFEDWLGSITDEQSILLRQASQDMVSTAPERLLRRLSWQRGIREILDDAAGETADAKARTDLLNDFFRRFAAQSDGVAGGDEFAGLREKTMHNRQVIITLIVGTARSLTNEQMTFFNEKTDYYIRILDELSANG